MLEVRTYVFNSFRVNTYIVSDITGECIIIDPGCENLEEREELISEINKYQLKPVKLINTHCHIDHILGNDFVKKTFSPKFLIHKLDQPLLLNSIEQGMFFGINATSSPLPDSFLNEGDRVKFGDSEFEILHIPGHSPGSIGLLNHDEKIMFTGDVLFQGGIGRTDLPGGDYHTLMNSIKEKILVHDPETVIYPGHGPETNIETEKNSNPFLNGFII